MVAKHYGKSYSLQFLREKSYITREGVSLSGISEAAETIGMRAKGVRISYDQLKHHAQLPCIVHWNQNHFIVVYKISGRSHLAAKKSREIVHIADPAEGLLKLTKDDFQMLWHSTSKNGIDKGVALLLEPSPDFYLTRDEIPERTGFKYLFKYLKPHRKLIVQLILSLFVGSILQLIFPFLTQSVVDFGIANQNMAFLYLVLAAQMMLYFGKAAMEFIRGWILLHISTRINVSLISDFLIKLMKLPIGFFDKKLTGDILQRIRDHDRIEYFLTNTSLNILFGLINLFVFGIVLLIYSPKICLVFLVGTGLYALWIKAFMRKRRELDYKRFSQLSENQTGIIQLITGMQEIKLHNAEHNKRMEWENIQARLFKLNIKSLTIHQYQQAGSVFINETKNIAISFLAASLVIHGQMTLGMMLAVQYIIGQMNSPIEQMIQFIRSGQDARISLERMGEIHLKDNEEMNAGLKTRDVPDKKNIVIENLSFSYSGHKDDDVLKRINLTIPDKKTTAIVGSSGSGKTTLLKLLLGFYEARKGVIKVEDLKLNNINIKVWRDRCGTVMQDGYLFSDTIANNIALGEDHVDRKKLLHAVEMANIRNFIESLPLGYNTKIGMQGMGLSQGQKQRVLIARAIYKNPEIILFDEATNALDTENEKVIMDNLKLCFAQKTAIVVAHRLSTVKNADQILVMEKGELVESGTHQELVDKRGYYYRLIKNQLELGEE
jgi:ATP-binding cassette subfamily B protein